MCILNLKSNFFLLKITLQILKCDCILITVIPIGIGVREPFSLQLKDGKTATANIKFFFEQELRGKVMTS